MISTNRKFKFVLAIWVVACIALFADKLSGGEYVTIVTLVFTGYITVNVTQKHVQKGGGA